MKEDIQHIILGCINNDRASQELLYKKYFPLMISMCLRYTRDRDQAMLVVNDGFLRVFKKIKSFENKGSLEAWIRRIVYHAISDYYRKEEKHRKVLSLEDYDKKTDRNVLDKLFADDLMDLINRVPAASADVFRLYAIDGYSHKEIAVKKGISIGTSKWHLSNARKILQELIFDQNMNQNYVFGQ